MSSELPKDALTKTIEVALVLCALIIAGLLLLTVLVLATAASRP